MFIERLNEALRKKKISGNELCKRINITNANYTNWKKQLPKGETLKQIANELDVSVDWLLERENAINPEQIELLRNYDICDELGKETIISIAELQAKRSKQNIFARNKKLIKEDNDDEELKPFA